MTEKINLDLLKKAIGELPRNELEKYAMITATTISCIALARGGDVVEIVNSESFMYGFDKEEMEEAEEVALKVQERISELKLRSN